MATSLEYGHFPMLKPIAAIFVLLSILLHYLVPNKGPQRLAVYRVGPSRKQPRNGLERARASLSSLFFSKYWLEDGNKKHSKIGSGYAMHDFNGETFIAMPPSQAKWFIDRKDHATSIDAAMSDKVLAGLSWPEVEHNRHIHTREIVRRHLTPKLDLVTPLAYQEIQHQLSNIWKDMSPGEWKDVCIAQDMVKVMTAVSCRVFFGDLAREKEFVDAISSDQACVLRRTWQELFIPGLLKPLLRPVLFTWAKKRNYSIIMKHLVPVIKQRLIDIGHNERFPQEARQIPEDFITWHYRYCVKTGNLEDLVPERVVYYALPVLFVSTAVPCMDFVNVLLNISAFEGGLDELHAEIDDNSNGQTGFGNRDSLARLYKTDSTIRESLRFSLLSNRVVERKVVSKDGIYNENGGWTAPYGSILCLDAWSRHRDPQFYTNPDLFDPFRYSKKREQVIKEQVEDRDQIDSGRLRQYALTSVSDSYLAFGLGNNACPGRFYVDRLFKMLLACILSEYEIQPLAQKPMEVHYASFSAPSPWAKLKVRRRRVDVRL